MANEQNKRAPVVLLAFANEHDGARLARLQDERRQLEAALEHLNDTGVCNLVIAPTATLDDISAKLLRHGDRIAVFHFAGHAGPAELRMETADGGSADINASGFARHLCNGRPPELVFLNGCSSGAQAEHLLNEGVRVVVGTTASIDDGIATEFAALFYKMLAQGTSISTAFEFAKGHFDSEFGKDKSRAYRDVYQTGQQPTEWPWQMYNRGDGQDAQWSLASMQNVTPQADTTLLGYMCDRKDQLNELFDVALPNNQLTFTGRPMGLLVHAGYRQAHDLFLRRISEWDLPRHLGRGQHDEAPVAVVAVAWKSSIDALRCGLSGTFTGTTTASTADIQQAIVEMRTSVIVKTTVTARDWQKSTPQLIEEWLRLFAELGDLPAGQLLIPAVLIVDPEKTGFKWFWQSTPQKFVQRRTTVEGLQVEHLSKLDSVSKDDVVSGWLSNDFESQVRDLVHDSTWSPADMAAELRLFVDQVYDESGTPVVPMGALGDRLNKKIRELLQGT